MSDGRANPLVAERLLELLKALQCAQQQRERSTVSLRPPRFLSDHRLEKATTARARQLIADHRDWPLARGAGSSFDAALDAHGGSNFSDQLPRIHRLHHHVAAVQLFEKMDFRLGILPLQLLAHRFNPRGAHESARRSQEPPHPKIYGPCQGPEFEVPENSALGYFVAHFIPHRSNARAKGAPQPALELL